MGNPVADDAKMLDVLKQVNLYDFLCTEQGLDTPLMEKGTNLSGGQCQRLALARAILHDSPVYIFDEATSNIDVESENDIMAQIYALAKNKTVILISHRLARKSHSMRTIFMCWKTALWLSREHMKRCFSRTEPIKNFGQPSRSWSSM